MNNDVAKDFLGNEIKEGDRGIRVHASGNWKEF